MSQNIWEGLTAPELFKVILFDNRLIGGVRQMRTPGQHISETLQIVFVVFLVVFRQEVQLSSDYETTRYVILMYVTEGVVVFLLDPYYSQLCASDDAREQTPLSADVTEPRAYEYVLRSEWTQLLVLHCGHSGQEVPVCPEYALRTAS